MIKNIFLKIKSLVYIIFFTFVISLILDFFLGKFFLNLTDSYWKNTNFYGRLIRIDHPVYHHGLKSNVEYNLAQGFEGNFTFCTDNNGFKYKCGKKREKSFEIGFIGDSFTEGISLDYEKTFVGIYEENTNKSVANLAAVSYSPKIYYSKINYLLKNNYKFDHIVLFIDISDLYDDDIYYTLNQDLTISENSERGENLFLRRILRKNFPFTNFYFYVIKNLNTESQEFQINQDLENFPKFNDKVNTKGSWTYSKNDNVEGYFSSVSEIKEQQLKIMNNIYELLKENKIKFSLAVYPWPHQLMYDNLNSEQVKMWEKFCISKCENFINFFPFFFKEKQVNGFSKTYRKFYFANDFHFNENGNKIIADKLIETIK